MKILRIFIINQENRIKLMLMNARAALGDKKKTEAC